MWVGQRCALWTWMRSPAHARIPAQQRRAARHARRLLILRKHHTRTAARARSCVCMCVRACVSARAHVRVRVSACISVRLRASACVHACVRTHASSQARGFLLVQLGEWVCACICTVDNRGLDPQIECDHRLFKCTCAQSPAQIFHGSMHMRAPTEMKRPARPIH